MPMSEATRSFLERLAEKQGPRKMIWCSGPDMPQLKHDEHQVCLDQEARHYANGYTSWSCSCRCHRR